MVAASVAPLDGTRLLAHAATICAASLVPSRPRIASDSGSVTARGRPGTSESAVPRATVSFPEMTRSAAALGGSAPQAVTLTAPVVRS